MRKKSQNREKKVKKVENQSKNEIYQKPLCMHEFPAAMSTKSEKKELKKLDKNGKKMSKK